MCTHPPSCETRPGQACHEEKMLASLSARNKIVQKQGREDHDDCSHTAGAHKVLRAANSHRPKWARPRNGGDCVCQGGLAVQEVSR